jgi:glutamyl-tRNA reductase
MKTVAIAFHNGLMAQSVAHTLLAAGCFRVHVVNPDSQECLTLCRSLSVDVLLLEATEQTFKTRPDLDCKIVVMCDDNSSPEEARRVVQAKKDGLIDDFVYTSVSESYLIAMLSAT